MAGSRPAHHPVLLKEVLEYLDPHPGEHLVDATVGAGGHARAILERTAPDGQLLGIDLDPRTLQAARAALAQFAPRLTFVHDSFDHLATILHDHHFPQPHHLIADLGLSSLALGDPARGFSFQHLDSPLDMRFDASPRSGWGSVPTAADILNAAPENELERILRTYGEERRSRSIAKAIVQTRRQSRIRTVGDLTRIVAQVNRGRRGKIHPATRTFQALRIAVNDELGRLARFLPQAVEALAPGGLLAVISFHSLEDRIVKQFFRRQAAEGRVRILTKHPATPSFAEVTTNPRSRSAKLRVAMRKPTNSHDQTTNRKNESTIGILEAVQDF